MYFGAHVSIAGGIANAPQRAADLGCEVFQIFSRSPRGGIAPALTDEIVKNFLSQCKAYNQHAWYIHTPYYLNLASSKTHIRNDSIRVIREELDRGHTIGATAIMTHLGSAKDMERSDALQLVSDGIAKVMDGYKGGTKFLLEISAGAGDVVGNTLEELDWLIREAGLARNKKIGVCIDTAHAFAAGYDMRTKKDVDSFVKKIDTVLGLERLGLFHCNDSMVELGARKDRHEHLGKGKIGKVGFQSLVAHPALKDIHCIVETPTPDGMKCDIALLKKMRGVGV